MRALHSRSIVGCVGDWCVNNIVIRFDSMVHELSYQQWLQTPIKMYNHCITIIINQPESVLDDTLFNIQNTPQIQYKTLNQAIIINQPESVLDDGL